MVLKKLRGKLSKILFYIVVVAVNENVSFEIAFFVFVFFAKILCHIWIFYCIFRAQTLNRTSLDWWIVCYRRY